MAVKQQIGRLGKLFAGNEGAGTYGTAAVLAATDALRHLDVGFQFSLNRRNSEEKKGTPGLTNRFSSHVTAGFDIRSAYLSPSGTIGTAPEAKRILKNGFGAERIGTGNTTAVAGGTATVFSVAVGQGANFAVNEIIVVRRVANGSKAEPRLITAIAGDSLTVAPALGAAPAAGDTVKAGVTYSLANTIPNSLTLARYLVDVSYQVNGAVTDRLGLMFSGNDEVKFRASGPAKEQIRPAQAQPGAFTTVGQPLTGIVGALLLNGTAYKITKLDAEVNNALELVNDSFGEDRAEDHYRNGRRDITLAIDARLTDDQALYALAETAGDSTLMCHAGNTEGRVVALYAPKAEWDIPEVPDDDGAIRLSVKGVAKETSGNDELYLGFL